jgi:hypothetical protein
MKRTRIGWMALALLMAFALAGCAGRERRKTAADPEAAAKAALEDYFAAVKAGDEEAIDRLTADDDLADEADEADDLLDTADDMADEADDEADADDGEGLIIQALGRHLTYRIRSAKTLSERRVTFRVAVTNVDMAPVVPALYRANPDYAADHSNETDAEEAAMNARMAKSLQTLVDRRAKDPKHLATRRMTADLQKIGGRWRLADPRETFLDAALGGYLTAMKNNRQTSVD